ncbi:hypothetical protein T492DRAFT_837254 [Pavlovales sp. CCMP2436]|nr:hypothetical protein T492DRAFT_837254 [Pavlovales sp. CCMP2436]
MEALGCFTRFVDLSLVEDLIASPNGSRPSDAGDHAINLIALGQLSSASSCREECVSDGACTAYTWIRPNATPAPGPSLGACWGVAGAPGLALLPRALSGAYSGQRSACSPPPSAPPGDMDIDDLAPDQDFYISGKKASKGMWAIFFGVLRALGQTAVLVVGGLWLGRRGVIDNHGAKALSAISMNLLIPALLFVRVLDAATFELIKSAWLVAVLPFIYVPCGALLGVLCVLVTRPALDFQKGMIAAIAFGNSTGLPIIILSVVNDALMTNEIRALQRSKGVDPRVPPMDPLVYLSIYSLTYPLLQWSVGQYLLESKGCTLPAGHPTRKELTAAAQHDAQPHDAGNGHADAPAAAGGMELALASPARSPGAQEQEQPPETDGAATLRGFPLLRSSTLQPSEASALWQRRPPQEAAPSLARAFSEPGRWNTPAAAAVHAGAHPRHPHHPRRARLAVATNLEAAADGEAGERVAPPMREADVQVVYH